MAFRNLSNKGNFAAEMVDLGMLKVVQSLKLQAWNDEVKSFRTITTDYQLPYCYIIR
jgi:hypothetical protein